MAALVSAAALLAGLLPAGFALAQQAAAPDQRCSGTLCDFFYSATGRSAPAAERPQPAAQAAVTQPPKSSEPAPPDGATPDGGFPGWMRGGSNERCQGTLCDFYYGSTSPADSRDENAERLPATARGPDSAAADGAERSARQSRGAEVVQRQETERCVSPAGDPWRCYR